MVKITSSENQSEETKSASPKKNVSKQSLIIGGVLLLILIAMISSGGDGSEQGSKSKSQQETQSEQRLGVGDEGIINRFEDKTRCELSTALGVTQDDQERITELSIAGDNLGLTEMILDGRAFIVDNCTEALVIGRTFTLREVRITDTESEHFGRSGWLPTEWIRAK